MTEIPAHRHEVKHRSAEPQTIEGGNDDAAPKARKPRVRKPKAKKPTPTPAPSPAAETPGDA